jgi:hypothetical protein
VKYGSATVPENVPRAVIHAVLAKSQVIMTMHIILFAVSNTALKEDNYSHKLNVYSHMKAISKQEKLNSWEPVIQIFMEKIDILLLVICNVLEFVYCKDG